jgi:ribosomal protein S18 acetylase RimI-like enzyme
MDKEPLMRQFEIRSATIDDVPGIRAMQAQSWLETYPNEENGVTKEWVNDKTVDWMTPEKIDVSKKHLSAVFADPTQFYRVSYRGNDVVGLIHVSTREDETTHLEGLYTDASVHGGGLAQELMALADDWIDGKQVTLEVASYNARAIRFYEKHGFKIVSGSGHLFANTIPTIDMIREGDNDEI